MIKVALKGLAGRKVRALLTALAVVIGVSMVSGTFVLTDTMQKAFDGIFEESYEGTDAVVSGKQLVEFSTGGRATVPARCSRRSRPCPSVEAAAGILQDLQSNSNPAKLLDSDGEIIGRAGRDDGRRHRRRRPPVLPAQAQAGRLGGRRRRDRPRRRHGEQVRLRGRRHDQGRRPPARPGRYKVTGVATLRRRSTRSAAPRWPSSTSRPRRPCSTRQGSYDSISVKAADGASPER